MANTLQPAQEAAGTQPQPIGGELVYEYTLRFTKVTYYGVPLAALLSSEAAPHVAGARIDVAFEAPAQARS